MKSLARRLMTKKTSSYIANYIIYFIATLNLGLATLKYPNDPELQKLANHIHPESLIILREKL